MIDKDLRIHDAACTGCSACTEACFITDENGNKAIQLIVNKKKLKVPRINSETCKQCMMCYKACPTKDKIFNNDVTFEKYRTRIGSCFYGYSLDAEHRFEAATAGIATEIAAYLLDTHQVDGVVSSYQDHDNQIISKIFTSSCEVKKTSGSIYRQVSMLNGLGEKIAAGNHKKILLLGLPCHIAGLKALQKANNFFRGVDFTTIALFCKQTKTEEFSDFERSMLGAKPNQKLIYRGKGWPGVTRVEGGRGVPFTNSRFSLMWGSFAFTPDYCFTCSDPLGVEADISIGDAWLRKYYSDKTGSSLFTANSKLGKMIIEEMMRTGKIYAEIETVENIIASQNANQIKFKTSHVKTRVISWGGIAGLSDKSDRYILLTRWIEINKKIVEFFYRTRVIRYIPGVLLKVYGRLSMQIFSKLTSRIKSV